MEEAGGRFKKALISVSNREGLVEWIRPLVQQGLKVVSTGGTARFLKQAGVQAMEVSQYTGEKEALDGRVKTLHQKLYLSVLARGPEGPDQDLLKKQGLWFFDLVVCNLYPLGVQWDSKEKEEGVEWIDVGGPSLLRAAAKNFKHLTVLCDPGDYHRVLCPPPLSERRRLAARVFDLLAGYNGEVARRLKKHTSPPDEDKQSLKKNFSLKADFFKALRYGENPSQKAGWFQTQSRGLHRAKVLQGKELSFNNIKDLDGAVKTLREFEEPACVAIKHTSPCGVAVALNPEEACTRALKADPVSVFGGVVALNRPVGEKVARELTSVFLEGVVAPDFSPGALTLLKAKKNLRVLKWQGLMNPADGLYEIQSVEGGVLMQDTPSVPKGWNPNWEVVCREGKNQNKLTDPVRRDLLMALKISAHLKSNAVALVSDLQSVGLSGGQVSRIASLKQAIAQWKTLHPEVLKPVVASDGFFPFTDSIEALHEAGLEWVVQPGGALRDQEIKDRVRQLSLNMVLTGERHFLH